MPNQFVVVSFPEDRMVFVGGTELGPTNQVLTINAGTHTFTLDDPQNYTPAEQRLLVADTSVAFPLQVTFSLADAPGAVPIKTEEVAIAPATRRRRKRRS